MALNVLTVLSLKEHHKNEILAAAPDCELVEMTPKTVTEEAIENADVIIGNVPISKLHEPKKLKLLQLNSAGTDGYLAKGVLGPNTVLTNATGAYSKAVGEHAFAMALGLQKKLFLYRDNQAACVWSDHGAVTSMADATVVIVGLGDIGLHCGRLCKAMGATVIGVKRRRGACPEGIDRIVLTEEIKSVLPIADVVIAFLPNTPATVHFFTDELFSLMKSTAIFINCGRGNAVSPEVLHKALVTEEIAAAGIDVADPEPLPSDSPLWKVPNLLITPHVSGGFHLAETFDRIVSIAAFNLKALSEGTPLKNIIDPTTGYKL